MGVGTNYPMPSYPMPKYPMPLYPMPIYPMPLYPMYFDIFVQKSDNKLAVVITLCPNIFNDHGHASAAVGLDMKLSQPFE